MPSNHRPRARSSLNSRHETQDIASFGFRHRLVGGNTALYNYLDVLQAELKPARRHPKQIRAASDISVRDPSTMGLKIVGRHEITNARIKVTAGKTNQAIAFVREGLHQAGVPAKSFDVSFDKIVPVGLRRSVDGRQRIFGLAPASNQESLDYMMDEYSICRSALEAIGIGNLEFPDDEWVPHLTVAEGPYRQSNLNFSAERILKNVGAITVKLGPLQFYSETNTYVIPYESKSASVGG